MRLQAAYHDTRGVTEAFVRNALDAVNRELDATFEQRQFTYEPRWDPGNEWMDIGLRASQAHSVSVRRLGLELGFDEGERLRVEVSSKFRRPRFEAELERAGFNIEAWWTDEADDFAVVSPGPVADVQREERRVFEPGLHASRPDRDHGVARDDRGL